MNNTTVPITNNADSLKPTPHAYENNPFFVATSGIELLFKKAQSVGILLAILAGLSTLTALPYLFTPPAAQPTQSSVSATGPTTTNQAQDVENFIRNVPLELWLLLAVLVLIGLLIAIFIVTVMRGIQDYTAAQIAQDKPVTIDGAFRAVFHGFWGYIWVLTIVGVKVFLWALLFIIPGIVMSVRYSLSGVAYFDKSLRGNQATKYSARLTKGGWLTTFASQRLLNLITLGAIPSLLSTGTNAVLYRQFKAVGDTKPKAHILSWLTLLVPFVAALLLIVVIMAFIALVVTQLKNG